MLSCYRPEKKNDESGKKAIDKGASWDMIGLYPVITSRILE
jgi:hypothetical protein